MWVFRGYTLTSLRRPCVCISASILIAGVNGLLNKTRFTTRIKSRRIVKKSRSFFKMSDKKRHNLLKTVPLLDRLIKQPDRCCQSQLGCFHGDTSSKKEILGMVTECHLFSIGLTICDLMCIPFVFLLYFQMDAKKKKRRCRISARIA